ELERSGATYYSDEYAVLDKRGRVHPYATPLAIREIGSYKQKNVSIEEFGGEIGVKPLPVGLVVITKYKSDERWRPHPLTAGQTMLELLANTVPARRKTEAGITTLQRGGADAAALKRGRGGAKGTAEFILEYPYSRSGKKKC